MISNYLFVLMHRPGSKMVLQPTGSTLYRSRLLQPTSSIAPFTSYRNRLLQQRG